jgi:hypothetical protein
MNISDLRTRVGVQNDRSRLVTRGAEPSTEPDDTVLTLMEMLSERSLNPA